MLNGQCSHSWFLLGSEGDEKALQNQCAVHIHAVLTQDLPGHCMSHVAFNPPRSRAIELGQIYVLAHKC